METSKLRKFASFARKSLIEQIGTKLKAVLAEGSLARRENSKAVADLEAKIADVGKQQTIETIAYTWFNRFCALRYMDVNRYTKIGILSPADGQFLPEILAEAKKGHIDDEIVTTAMRERVMRILDGTDPSDDPQGEAYRLLLVAACNHYHSIMPFMFEKIADYTELLLPDDLFSGSAIPTYTREALLPANCLPENTEESVEVIGWLYQFYIADKKDDVFAALKKGKKITPENIPAATQLFTPHWIVRYLVENSLGRLWMLNHPESRLAERMDYYIKPDELQSVHEPPCWQHDWREHFRHVDGRWRESMWLRPNPQFVGDFERATWYCLSIDGHGYEESHWPGGGIPAEVREAWERGEYSDSSFEDLRCWLFHLQRRNHEMGPGDGPDDPFWKCYRAVCNAWTREWRDHIDDLTRPPNGKFATASSSSEDFLQISSPEEIKICDPACGSGHMLTYAFDLLYAIYEEQGYQATDIPRLILTHNLYGIEIDQRAGALAAFALTMKAREKYRRFLQPGKVVQPNICVLENIEITPEEFDAYLHDDKDGVAKGLLGYCQLAIPLVFSGESKDDPSLPTIEQILEYCDYERQAFQLAEAWRQQGKLFTKERRRWYRADEAVRKKLFLVLREGDSLADCTDPTLANFFVKKFREIARGESLLNYAKQLDLERLVTDFYLVLLNQFKEADNFGSLIQPLLTDVRELSELLRKQKLGEGLFFAGTHPKVLRSFKQAGFLCPEYEVVIANPPYMFSKGMNANLKTFAAKHFTSTKSDSFAMFVERCLVLGRPKCTVAMITQQSWMFLATFNRMRESLFTSNAIISVAHFGARAFDTIGGEVVSTAAFVLTKSSLEHIRSTFVRLIDGDSEAEKNSWLLKAAADTKSERRHSISVAELRAIPGWPLAYWLTRPIISTFSVHSSLGASAIVRGGMTTGDNDAFVRYWYECEMSLMSHPANGPSLQTKWCPYNKGGSYRKWYGNRLWIVNWENEGNRIKTTGRASVRSEELYLREMIGWTDITGFSQLGVRYYGEGFIFDASGPSVFTCGTEESMCVLGYLGTKVTSTILGALNPTLHVQAGNISSLPWISLTFTEKEIVAERVREMIAITRSDWDESELSWDFQRISILSQNDDRIANCYGAIKEGWGNAVVNLQSLEQQNNDFFINKFDSSNDLAPSVPLNEITLECNPYYRYGADRTAGELDTFFLADTMREFISSSVGCMFGRYSLDKPGLILANQGEILSDYLRKLYQETTPIEPNRAIAEPKSVVFLKDAPVSCFGCKKQLTIDDATFAVDAEIVESQTVKTTALLYCDDCVENHKLGHLIHRQKLKHFSIRITLDRDWCDVDSLKVFIDKAGCFAHPIPLEPAQVTFLPDENNVIPILEGDWFADDISERFKEFLKVTFGTEHYAVNLKFLEDALYPENATGRKRKTIRDYFLKDFYNHHIKLYKKRPIYWLFSSPKGTFNALIYMHRYRPDTVSTVLQYLRDFRDKLAHRAEHQQMVADSSGSTTAEKAKALKEVTAIKKQLKELEEYERETLFPLAQKKQPIDLDDGVKHNYQLFGTALKNVTGLS